LSQPAVPLVAHVIHRLDVGGLENGIVNLVNRMPAARYRHAILCMTGFSDFRRRITRPDVQVVSLDKREGKDPAAYVRLFRLLRTLRPSIVHTRNIGTLDCQWVAAAAGVRRRVHGEHGWVADDPQGRNSKNLRFRRLCAPAVQRYVPMSLDIAAWLERDVGVRPQKIHQIYSGVDTDRFQPGTAGPPGLPWSAESFDGDRVVLGTVGRLDPVKNQGLLLGAVHRILESRPELRRRIRLIIAGDGPLRASLAATVQRRGLEDVVWLPGARDDVPDLMRSMDLFVLPSLNEGISNTILEAMASALPVVAGRVGGNPELVEEGTTGMLFAGGSEGELVDALSRYLEAPDLRVRHGLAGRRRVLEQFSLDSMVQRYSQLYDQLMAA
jgi:sugar transferase (PEP-CTERM/EpsH1 system associated)